MSGTGTSSRRTSIRSWYVLGTPYCRTRPGRSRHSRGCCWRPSPAGVGHERHVAVERFSAAAVQALRSRVGSSSPVCTRARPPCRARRTRSAGARSSSRSMTHSAGPAATCSTRSQKAPRCRGTRRRWACAPAPRRVMAAAGRVRRRGTRSRRRRGGAEGGEGAPARRVRAPGRRPPPAARRSGSDSVLRPSKRSVTREPRW